MAWSELHFKYNLPTFTGIYSLSSSRDMCQKVSTNWGSQTWQEFDQLCEYNVVETQLIACLADVREPCQLGCTGLSYCSNFNNRSGDSRALEPLWSILVEWVTNHSTNNHRSGNTSALEPLWSVLVEWVTNYQEVVNMVDHRSLKGFKGSDENVVPVHHRNIFELCRQSVVKVVTTQRQQSAALVGVR